MNIIKKVRIDGFWGSRTVEFKLQRNVNFLIGINGSGKTTIINLIAAVLKGDLSAINKVQFERIKINLENADTKEKHTIQVEKKLKEKSNYSDTVFTIKKGNKIIEEFSIDEYESEHLHFRRANTGRLMHRKFTNMYANKSDVLSNLINITWLSIHRKNRSGEERNYDSTIDAKIDDVKNSLIRYFSKLNRQCSVQTDQFQKFVFESLVVAHKLDDINKLVNDLDYEKEKKSLKEIFKYFHLAEDKNIKKLEKYFKIFEKSYEKMKKKEGITLDDISVLLGMVKIHSVSDEWFNVQKIQSNINKPKDLFFQVVNNLLQNKKIEINEKNELFVQPNETDKFNLVNLSSGEKQLLIILGQALLQELNTHIYIADEPELSLHVEWQEKLVKSINDLNPNAQMFFATHSPDIIGPYHSSIIRIEDCIS